MGSEMCIRDSDSTSHGNTTDISMSNRNGVIPLLLAACLKPASRSRHPPRHIHKHGSHRCLAGTSGLSLQQAALRPLVSGPRSSGLSDNSDTSASRELLLSCTAVPANMWHQFILLVKQGDSCSFINIRDRPSSNTERIIQSQKSSSKGSHIYSFSAIYHHPINQPGP